MNLFADPEFAPLPVRSLPEPKVPAFVRTASYVGTQKTLDSATRPEVSLDGTPQPAANFNSVQKQETVMQLTLVGHSKNGRAAFYAGAAQRLRISVGAFPNKTAPTTIEVADGAFAPARQPKAKLTKEERAALPKPTLAEKIAKREAALAALKAKAEKEAAAANQPQL